MGTLAKTFTVCIVLEFCLVFQYLVLVGAMSGGPLPAVTGICQTAGTNPYDLGVAIFIIGSMLNVVLVMPLMVILSRGGPWS